MQLRDIEKRLSDIKKEIEQPNADLDSLEEEIEELEERKKAILDKEHERRNVSKKIANGEIGEVVKRFGGEFMENTIKKENNEDIEVRSLQKYLVNGPRAMSETEERALNLSGAAAVVPTNITNELITSEKYSDLLSKATVIKDTSPGKVYVPVASNTAASWKTENSDGDEAAPTMTKLELSGYELMRVMQMSSAAATMSTGNFGNLMLKLLGDEVVETLEKSFIDGSGTGQPKGLDNLTWTPDTNQILTADASTAITAADIAEALSLLPQKYARNAVIVVNSDMMYQISQFKGTSEYAYDLATPTNKFLNKEIIVSEHMADDTVYIVDPSQLYVRFSLPIQVEADRSAGFTSASIYLRALTVVDAVWNPAACVAVGLGA